MTRPAFLTAAALIGPAVILSAALFSQHVGGLNPCKMCIWQRWPHAIAIGLAALALLAGARVPRAASLLLTLGAGALLIGAGIGVFHAGVEQGWWEGPTTCSGGDVGALSTEQLLNSIMNAPLVRCDEIAWSFLGLSMAAWNAVASVALAGLTVLAARAWR